MQEDMLFQFVGFETTVGLDDFSSQWENFAKKFFKQDIHAITLQQQLKSKTRFKYMSMNEWPQDKFCFSFMEGRGSDYFPDHRVKVVQAGGYAPVRFECSNCTHGEVKLLLLLREEAFSEQSFVKMPHHHLNIYEAYYQSCLYSHIVELFTDQDDAVELYDQLKKRYTHGDVGMYRECLVLEG
jgi:hypothetical protein